MAYETEFVQIPLEQLEREAAIMKADGWRFIQTHAVNGDIGIDLYYSFMKDGVARNYKIVGVTKEMPVPSITDKFLAAFVFENEARELFGVDMQDIAIDFHGAMYAPAVSEPMTIISPKQKAAREKAAKAAAAKAVKADTGDSEGKDAAAGKHVFVMTPERRARLDAKLANMYPEKVAKVEAALKAREAEAANSKSTPAISDESTVAAKQSDQQSNATVASAEANAHVDVELESTISRMDPAKAEKVRAALAKRSGTPQPSDTEQDAPGRADAFDAQVEAKLQAMDPEKAAKVRAALNESMSRKAVTEGGE